jgi:hypothetical protein
MGNRALRREVVKLMKERHVPGKLYSGHRHSALRGLRAWSLRQLKSYLSIKPGDVVHDCDGFNHIVRAVEFYKTTAYTSNSKIVVAADVVFEDGRIACNCSVPKKPRAREEIEAYFRAWYADNGLRPWWHELGVDQRRCDALKNGQHICDKRGVLLPEFGYVGTV